MHVIPESWPHLHILISLFPLVGLLFVLGFYVASIVTNNDGLKRICLLAIVGLGVLSIPIYVSGMNSITPVSARQGVTEELINAHYNWSLYALLILVLAAVAAGYEWMRAGNVGRFSTNALHLILGLSLITLLMMIASGESGWEINHQELGLAQVSSAASALPSGSDIPEGQGTPEAWSHWHIILNHFPSLGLVVALGFFITGLIMDNTVMKRGALVLFTICGILGVPTYVTGASSMWALTDPPLPYISQAAINAHRDMALWTLFGLAATGVAAWVELWRFRYLGRFSQTSLYVVLGLAIVTLGLIAETGHRGGQINHAEIRTEPLPTDPNAFLSPAIEAAINNVQWFVPWQTVHFFGYCLIFGTVAAVVLRVFGIWKSLPFSAVHRLLPLGVMGVVMNVFSGMLMLLADTFRYVNSNSFPPKMAFIVIGGIAVLYFSLSEQLWNTKAGEEAPMTAKWVAGVTLLAWTGVIMGGRLIPYV
jgi:uncharacterized membrane protein